MFPEKRTIQELNPDDFINTMSTNLFSQFYSSQLFAEQNLDEGKIINIASVGGTKIFKNRIDYNLSKNGVIHLTKILAKELAPNIAVNCICPGVVDFYNKSNNDIPVRDSIPMKRYATIEELLEVVLFFATCSNYITGQTIYVSGGMEL